MSDHPTSQRGKAARKIIPIAAATEQPLFEARRKIQPRSISGVFARWRWAMVWLTQLFFYGIPWLQINERQALLFDLEQRRFYIFGWLLYPQDFIYLTTLLIISALALFLFTAVAGRLWCGFSCPQTVYTELFMWVERRLEGDRSARLRLDGSGWGAEKIAREGAWMTPGVLTDDTADMTMALILAVCRRVVEGANAITSGEWTGWSPTWMLGARITGKRLGIVGMGRIGQAVARRARAFGLSIHYHNRRRLHGCAQSHT